MDSLFLFQFACFIFMLINAFIVALSHLHVRWENKRYERSRWMIVAALIGLAIQYVMQMTFGFRANLRKMTGKRQGSICHDEKVAYRPFLLSGILDTPPTCQNIQVGRIS